MNNCEKANLCLTPFYDFIGLCFRFAFGPTLNIEKHEVEKENIYFFFIVDDINHERGIIDVGSA